jgi:mRNA deadenylase 3'-5' endonuclease subunit Ccr4
MSSFEVNVVQYNVLSSALSNPTNHPHNDQDDLNPDNRYNHIISKLTPEIKKSAVICLQEVSEEWVSKFIVYFHKNDYTMIYRLYGNKFNGYMGIAIAFPAIMKLNRMSIKMIGSLIPKGDNSVEQTWGDYLWSFYEEPVVVMDHWARARNKWNSTICLELEHDGNVFVVATYHMPCDFNRQTVMMLHTHYLNRYCQDFAVGLPLILTVDANSTPDRPATDFTLTGKSDFVLQTSNTSVDVELNCEPMSSVLPVNDSTIWTCNSQSQRSDEPFIGMLDYIFTSKGAFTQASYRSDVTDELMPNKDEPSDHVMLTAYIKFITDVPIVDDDIYSDTSDLIDIDSDGNIIT